MKQTTVGRTNPAFQVDEASTSNGRSRTGSATGLDDKTDKTGSDTDKSPKPPLKSALKTSSSFPKASPRRPSVADVALSLHTPSRSHGGYEGPLFERDSGRNLYIHPFGNPGNMIEEMLLEQGTSRSRRKNDGEKHTPSTTPAHLIIWVVFTFFMVGIAAAIIFGAGSGFLSTAMTVASTMHGGNIPRLPMGMARAAVQLYRSSSILGPGLVPLDGCVLLGKDETTATCEYATRFFISDREAQRQLVVNQVALSSLVPCCAPHEGCAIMERIWGFISSELTLLALHLICLIVGFLKIYVHTLETHHDLHLIHAVLETIIACSVVIIRAFATRRKFYEIKEARVKFEYHALAHRRAVKVRTCFYFLASLLLCALIVGFFVICFLYAHLGWITFTHQAVIIITAFIARYTLNRYDLMIARIERDQHTIVLLEGATLLVEQMCALSTSQKEDVNSRVGHYLRGLNRSTAFDRPPYISYMDEHEELEIIDTGM